VTGPALIAPSAAGTAAAGARNAFLRSWSIEAMPRSLEKISSLADLLPAGTEVFLAHVEGVPIKDMHLAARRILDEGFKAVPHLPARLVPSRAALTDWLEGYRQDAGVEELLVLAGGVTRPRGPWASSMDVLSSGEVERLGFAKLHVAGHPEGNRDIAPADGAGQLDAALQWKQAHAAAVGMPIEIATQFTFDASAVLAWATRIHRLGIHMPVRVGVAGPARIGTLLRYAALCGVGASARMLKRKGRGAAALLRTHGSDDLVGEIAAAIPAGGAPNLRGIHVFPFGGISSAACWAAGLAAGQPATAPS